MTNTLQKEGLRLKNLSSKVSINPFFWPIIIGAFLTGQFIEIITLFGIVIIHELGHIFAAASYHWQIQEIELLPFGGVAKVEANNDSIKEEIIVAIAGPMQNFIMVIVSFIFLRVHVWSNEWAIFFIQANIFIGLFNLIPVSPLDGKRIFINLLYIIFPFRRATLVAIFISIFLTIIFIGWSVGLFYHFKINLNGLILSTFFIYNNYLDIKNAPYQFWNFLLHRLEFSKKKRNRVAVPLIVDANTTQLTALRLLKKDRYHLFYLIADDGEIVSILPEEKLLKAFYRNKEIYQPIIKLIT